MKTISNFRPKPWTNLLAENADFATFSIYCVEKLIFCLERYERLFMCLFDLKNRE